MTGFVSVDPAKLPDEAAIKSWVSYCLKYAKTLPPK
jgi:hypothetical protein